MNRKRLKSNLHTLLSAGLLIVSASVGAAEKGGSSMEPLDCVINPSVVADLGSGVPGILASVSVDRSDFVKAGDVIAQLESSVETAALELARSRAALDAEIDLRRVNAAFGQRQNKRTRDLFKRKAISTNDMDERETEARLSHIQLRQAQDNKELAQLEMQRAEEILNRRTIKSPIDGVVMERFKVIGEYVEDQPVVRVARIDPLHVEVIVPVDRLGMIENGMHAKVWSETVKGETWQARVTRVDRIADVASGTYGVRLTMPNPNHDIPAGLRCRMQLVEAPAVPVNESAVDADKPAAQKGIAVTSKLEKSAPPIVVKKASPQQPVMPVKSEPAPTIAKAKVETEAVKPEPSVEPQTVVVAAAAEQAEKALPPGFKPIERRPAVTAVAVEKASTDVDVQTAEMKTDAVVEAVEQAAKKADVADSGPDPDQLAADLVEDEAETLDVDPVEALPACRLAGPYSDEVKATRKVVTLRRSGLDVDIKSMSLSKSRGYMIATPVLRDRAEAKALVAKLEAAGITDHYLPRSSRKPLRISLGLYKGPKIAKRQIRILEKKGFKAELLPWKQRGTEYYLVIRDAPAGVDRKLLSGLPVPEEGSEVTRRFCDQVAAR